MSNSENQNQQNNRTSQSGQGTPPSGGEQFAGTNQGQTTPEIGQVMPSKDNTTVTTHNKGRQSSKDGKTGVPNSSQENKNEDL
jgi:hypothetical protein